MSSESPPSVNPYAPTEALAHGDAPGNDHAQPTARRAGRFAAIVVAILSYPLAGAGLYVLGRRSAVVWMIAGFCTHALAIASVVANVPVMFLAGFALNLILALASIVYTLFARPGTAPPRGNQGVLVVVLLILAVRGGNFAAKKWLAEGYQMPSGSMMPTLLVGDQLMVAKTKRIAAGDLVVFRYPPAPDITYMKRAVAVGGQTIEIKDGIIWVDGTALKQWALVGDCPSSGESDTDNAGCRLLQENAGKGWYSIMRTSSADAPPYVVPPDHVYVLGDNRDNSSDSRVWGPVSRDLVEGRPVFVWASQDRSGQVRWNRIGLKLN